jgi:hypothetical protein
VWHRLRDDSLRQAVATVELYADGLVPRRALRRANQEARWAETELFERFEAGDGEGFSAASALVAATAYRISRRLTITVFDECQEEAGQEAREHGLIREAGYAASAGLQSELIRDIFGPPPFSPPPPPPAGPAPTVRALAQAGYDERHLPSGLLDAAHLAVLADALEDAGCTDAAILGHLRGPGPHVRGCWALDLILGRE